jgi:hypothetical protein
MPNLTTLEDIISRARLGMNAAPQRPGPDRPVRYTADIPLAALLAQLPEGDLQRFLLGLDPQLHFKATGKTPWDLDPALSLGFSLEKRF